MQTSHLNKEVSESLDRRVKALARELFEVAHKAAKEAAPCKMHKWKELNRHVVIGHEAIARYVLKNFKRSTTKLSGGGATDNRQQTGAESRRPLE